MSARMLTLWRGSLKIRIMAMTGLVTFAMITATWFYVSTSVGTDLFENRRDEVLADAAQATIAAQRLLDASDASDRASLTNLMVSMRSTIRDTSSSSQVLVRREQGQPTLDDAPLDFTTDAGLASVITPELTEAVARGEHPQYWQSVTLLDANGDSQPGIVVASPLTFPGGVGTYQLFIGYSLTDPSRLEGPAR